MDKEKILNEIEKKLDYLNAEQKQEEIFRINNELDNGKNMENIDKEVEKIYKKYKINVSKKKEMENSSVIQSLKIFKEKIKKNNWKKNLTIFKDIVIIILIVSILKIPFIGLEQLLFSVFSNNLTDKMFTVFNYMIEIVYVIFAIFMFVRLFKRRFKEEMK